MDPEAAISRRGYGSFLKHYPNAFDSGGGRHRFVQQGLSLSRVFEVGVGRYEWLDRHGL